MNALVEAQYFPPVAFFILYLKYNKVKIVSNSRFEKQSYRNRCEILGSNKVQSLVVPVQKGKSKLEHKSVKLIDTEPWRTMHWRTIQSAYGKAPFFEHYAQELKELLEHESEYVFDFSLATIRWAERILQLEPAEVTVVKQTNGKSYENLVNVIHPKKTDSAYLRGLNFDGSYFQCFNHSGFVANLSIIDLIMNEGPMGIDYLKGVAKV